MHHQDFQVEPFIEHQGERRLFWLRKARAVGGKILIARPGASVPDARKERVVVRLDPESAFGTGGHGTTEGCLVALERSIKGGESVLDVGTGTGILAIAARKLGAGRIVAVDIDPGACRATTKNLAVNGIDDVLVTRGGVESVDGRFDVVVANLRTPILLEVMDDLVARMADGGLAIFSGILERELHPFLAFLEHYSINVLELQRNHGWMTLTASGKAESSPLSRELW